MEPIDEEAKRLPATKRRKLEKFTPERRREILHFLETGAARTVRAACDLALVDFETANYWLIRGKRTVRDYMRAMGDEEGELAYALAQRYRVFYLAVKQAIRRSGAVVDVVLTEAALGRQVEKVNPKTGETYIAREGGDWRAADALGKRQERQELQAAKRELMKAQAEKERHAADAARELARRAKADADRAELLAEAARRASKETMAAVVFTPTFLAALEAQQPELHTKLVGFMGVKGYSVATQEQAAQAAAERDPDRDEEMLRLADAWGLVAKTEPPPIDDERDEDEPK